MASGTERFWNRLAIIRTFLKPPFHIAVVLRRLGDDSETSRAPRIGDLGTSGGSSDHHLSENKERGALGAGCMLLARLVCCCRRGTRLAPLHAMLDEETEELVELLNREFDGGMCAFMWTA